MLLSDLDLLKAVVFLFGFSLGYGVRAYISHRRRAKAIRSRGFV